MDDKGKQVSLNGKQPDAAVQANTPEPVYKITPDAYAALGAYLLTRPLREVQGLYKAFFKHEQKDPFYKQEAINRLVDYLLGCPMGEVEGLMQVFQAGLQQYLPQVEPKEIQKETPPADSAGGKEIPNA